MTDEITARGIILNVYPQGENGKRLDVLTDRFGKLCIFASGAAKTGSKLIGALRPMTAAEFMLIRGRSSYRLHTLKVMNTFEAVSTGDYENYCLAMYVLETAGYFSQEGMPEEDAKRLLNLMYLTLEKLGELQPGLPGAEQCAEKRQPAEQRTVGQSTAEQRIAEPRTVGQRAAEYHAAGLVTAIYELRLLMQEGIASERPPVDCTANAEALWKRTLSVRLSQLFSTAPVNGRARAECENPADADNRDRIDADGSDTGENTSVPAASQETFEKKDAESFARAVGALFKKQVPHEFRSLKVLREI